MSKAYSRTVTTKPCLRPMAGLLSPSLVYIVTRVHPLALTDFWFEWCSPGTPGYLKVALTLTVELPSGSKMSPGLCRIAGNQRWVAWIDVEKKLKRSWSRRTPLPRASNKDIQIEEERRRFWENLGLIPGVCWVRKSMVRPYWGGIHILRHWISCLSCYPLMRQPHGDQFQKGHCSAVVLAAIALPGLWRP